MLNLVMMMNIVLVKLLIISW